MPSGASFKMCKYLCTFRGQHRTEELKQNFKDLQYFKKRIFKSWFTITWQKGTFVIFSFHERVANFTVLKRKFTTIITAHHRLKTRIVSSVLKHQFITYSLYGCKCHSAIFISFFPRLLDNLCPTTFSRLEEKLAVSKDALLVCLFLKRNPYIENSNTVLNIESNIFHTISMFGQMCTHN